MLGGYLVMDWHPMQGRVEIFLVANATETRVSLAEWTTWLDGIFHDRPVHYQPACKEPPIPYQNGRELSGRRLETQTQDYVI